MEAYIVGGVRTAVGRFNGSLASLNTIDLGSEVIREVLRRTSIKGSNVDEVIMGNVLQAGLGQNPARQAAIMAGSLLLLRPRQSLQVRRTPLSPAEWSI